jgi:hypothetical protein
LDTWITRQAAFDMMGVLAPLRHGSNARNGSFANVKGLPAAEFARRELWARPHIVTAKIAMIYKEA